MNIEKYVAQAHAPRSHIEVDLGVKRANLARLRDAALKEMADRHELEKDALLAGFDQEFDELNGRPSNIAAMM